MSGRVDPRRHEGVVVGDVPVKHCHGCGRDLPETEFSKDRLKPDGLQTECKDCKKAYREAHPESAESRRRAMFRARMSRAMAVAHEDYARVYMPGRGYVTIELPPMGRE